MKELPQARLRQIDELITVLERDPVPFRIFDIRRIEGYRNLFGGRLGSLRIIYEVDENAMRIKLIDLDPRGKAYKNL